MPSRGNLRPGDCREPKFSATGPMNPMALQARPDSEVWLQGWLGEGGGDGGEDGQPAIRKRATGIGQPELRTNRRRSRSSRGNRVRPWVRWYFEIGAWRLPPIDRECARKLAMGRHRSLSTGMMECQLLPLVGTIRIPDQRERQPRRYRSHRVITHSQRSWPVRQD